ncbi:MAG: peptidylprolyl isomerase [Saprospiraceae bacterium]
MSNILLKNFVVTQVICRAILFGLALLVFSACAKPIAKFSSDLSDNTAPASIGFANESVKADTYLWDFGDGQSSTDANPSHRYATSGNYLVTLQASAKDEVSTESRYLQILAPASCLVEITTSHGKIVVSLSDKTPLHRDNFLKLVEEGFYTDLLFHRIVNGFVVQGGDPTGLGTGGPGYEIPAEFDQELAHIRGALAAARTPDEENPERKSSGSQFYIVSGRPVEEQDLDGMQISKGISYSYETRAAYLENGGLPILDADYTVFGQVIEGMEVIDALINVAVDDQSRPEEDVTMKMKVIN